MTKINKIIVFLLVGILFLILLLTGQKGTIKKEEPPLPFGQITRENRIQHVEWSYKNNKPYEQFALIKNTPKDLVVTSYQPNPRDPNIPYKERRGGILIFRIINRNPELFWESEENISLTHPAIDVRDITGDGKSEIISLWSDGKTDILYLYSWDGNIFRLITPMKKVTGLIGGSGNLYAPIFGVSRGDIQVKDLDADGVDEVIIISGVTLDEFGNELPALDRKTIYKFNGQVYELWKEEKVKE